LLYVIAYIPYPQNYFLQGIDFGYCQETMQVDRASENQLFDVNCLFCNKDNLVEKVSSILYLALLLSISLAKV
jgi:hypothetical protein